ncbi:hypothetical protein XENTR_v10003263 [Xenopus tropicalis]|uniref:Resistin-like beta n=1 Tax=Xenopus tropicalis TaxID=8364 RepID=A0A803JHY6_XENTR|nr:resistin-like beta [Xenopus tropicalis]KAE8637007.1 hypothetical protein XENTR_v10003263 [Xenopus tropicalis]
MKLRLTLVLLVLVLVPAIDMGGANDCSITDLIGFNSLIKSMVASALEKTEIDCIDARGNGAYATCPAGTMVVSCACGMGCGSWDIQSKSTCHCQCGNMDWTTARCCKVQSKH